MARRLVGPTSRGLLVWLERWRVRLAQEILEQFALERRRLRAGEQRVEACEELARDFVVVVAGLVRDAVFLRHGRESGTRGVDGRKPARRGCHVSLGELAAGA